MQALDETRDGIHRVEILRRNLLLRDREVEFHLDAEHEIDHLHRTHPEFAQFTIDGEGGRDGAAKDLLNEPDQAGMQALWDRQLEPPPERIDMITQSPLWTCVTTPPGDSGYIFECP
jgi:hypothetical protein